jgi:hypothetical protein
MRVHLTFGGHLRDRTSSNCRLRWGVAVDSGGFKPKQKANSERSDNLA